MKLLRQLESLSSKVDLSLEQAFIEQEIESIGQTTITNMINASIDARKKAYAKYSGFKVGAAVLVKTGEIYAAPNNEFVSYSETGHAEGNAISKAISEGEFIINGREFLRAIVICGSGVTGPCGRCRQCIAEHAIYGNALIISVNPRGLPTLKMSLQQLLPHAFTPAELGIK